MTLVEAETLNSLVALTGAGAAAEARGADSVSVLAFANADESLKPTSKAMEVTNLSERTQAFTSNVWLIGENFSTRRGFAEF
jgi:hypothetical protein